MQELQASTLELIKIISDCLVFNTHLKKLDLSGCEMKEVEVKLLAEALRVNSTLEYLNITWCNLGDAGSAALAAGLGINEGLKVVDMRHNRITAKGLHAIASFLRTNITLLELLLSKSEQLLIAGDDLIFDDSDNSSLVDQEHRDKHRIEEILLSNKTLSKCFSGESKKVDLSGRGMEKVPSLFLVIPTIVSLDLSHNRLKYLPRGIKQLTRLEFLNLSHNHLQELPLELGTLHTLKHLDVQHNNLTEVPLTLNLLDNLEVLDISHNNISFLPVSLGTLPSLKELHAHSNPLPYPKKVVLSSAGTGVLSYLREKNSGSALCHRIKLMCVGQANVGKTSLVEKLLSKSVTKPTESESGSARAAGRNAHPDDQDLGTSGASVGAEVNNKALSAVKRTDSERNRRWSYSEVEHGKLALVSSGGASGGDEWDGNDKSSSPASKARRRPGKRLDVATDGIRIRDWTAKSISRKDSSAKADKKDSNSSKAEGSKENIITFSSWDFAGQEIYYYTHLFFLSRRGIYLLIFNLLKPEEEASRIEYWLQSIHTRARGAPVILVGTHLDAKKCTKKYLDHLYANLLQKFSGQFKNIRFFFALSCATGKGVEDLRKKLIEVAQSMIEKEGLIPQSYLTLEEKIRAIAMLEPQPVVSWEMFERLALSSGVTQPVLPKAAKYLHQLGSLVHFNERESGLDDLVILDSQWLTNVFSDVITLKHNFVKSGVLQRKDLPQIWKAPAYPETVHDSLVALLEQFEVAYALPPTDTNPQGAILVPCLLPDARPADLHNPDLWPKEESDLVQLFRFYSFDFMPFGFFNRFMVRLLRSGWTLIRCWKNGMFFAKGDDKLLLELDMEVAFRLKLCMRGTAPSRQMLVLTAMIDTLIADWLRVDVKVTIPCTHCINENAQPFLFTQSQLEQAVAKGKTVVNCRGVDVVGIFALAPDLVMLDLNRIIVKQEDMRIIDQLALNNRTKVFKAQLGDETVVVKQFREESLSASSLSATAVSNEFRAQVWEIGGLEHPNIVPLRGMCEDPFSLVMEHVEGPSLETFLADPASHRLVPLDWKFRIKIAADIARAMMFLHNLTPRVLNGRLTSSNVLLAMENVSQESVVVAKIADFGLFWAPFYVENREDAPYWLAPEVLSKQKHTAQSDVYSYGTLLYELVTGETLFASQIPESGWSGVEKRIIAGDRPEVPTDCYVEYKDLMADCWNADPALRPSFESILKRISRIAIKYNLPLPGPSGKIALPSYSVRKFSVAYENEEEDTRRNKSRRRMGSSPPMPLEETDTESEVEEQATETLAPTAAAATSNVAPAPTPTPAEAPKEENSIKKRLQNTLATLQRELESDEQELTTSTGAVSPTPSSPSNATGAAVPRLPSSGGTAAPKKQAEASTPPPLRRREANTPTVAAGGRQVSTLTLRSSGSGSMKAQAEQEDKGSFNSALQRQADRMREQVESLQSQLKEAKKAQSKAERSLAFQILENDRQHTQMERLKRKVEALKSENDKLVKEAARQSGTPGTAPRMMKTVRTGQASKQSSPAPLRDGERDLATVAASTATSGSIAPREDDGDTPALASSMSEDHNKKRQLTAISTSTRAQRGLFTPYASPEVPAEEVDVREIQERLRRRSLSKRILDRLAYWENMQQRQVVPAAPSSLGSKSSGLASRASTTHARPITRSPKLGEREPHRRASDGDDKGKEKDDGEEGAISGGEELKSSGSVARKKVELRIEPQEDADEKRKSVKLRDDNDQQQQDSAPSDTATRTNKDDENENENENENDSSSSEREGGGDSRSGGSGLTDSTRSVDDVTSAKRKFLKRSSSSNNSMARKRLSTSGKSLRELNPRFSLAPGASLSASGPVALAADELTSSSSAVAGINQIFYGKAELVKLLLELDEFD